jgi:hypothetical protein
VAVTVDSPRPGDAITEPAVIRGWAVVSGRGAWQPAAVSGVPAWHAPVASVWVTVDDERDARLAGGPGVERPDVARALGTPAAARAGFAYRWDPAGTAPGAHVLEVCAADPAARDAVCVPLPVRTFGP